MFALIKKHALTLAFFTLITTLLTAAVYFFTKPIVDEQILVQKQRLLEQVIPQNMYDQPLQKECYLIANNALGDTRLHAFYLARKNQQPVAVAIDVTAPEGYAGAIKLLVGADFNGTLLGVRVIEHHETPGLGDKIDVRRSAWITRLSGRKIDTYFRVKKDGGNIDQFTGATITPRALVNAARRAVIFIQTLPARLDTLPSCGASHDTD